MDTRKLLFIILVLILVLYLSGFAYLMVAYVSKRRKQDELQQNMMNMMNLNMMNTMNSMMNNMNNQQPKIATVQTPSCDMNSPQTDFFKKSVIHAEKVLYNNVFLDAYKHRHSVDLTKIDEATKKSIVVAMQYMMIDPINSKSVEQTFRMISEQENVPLWFVILHEGIKKIIPLENASQLTDEELLAELEKRKLERDKQDKQKATDGGTIVSINQVA